MLDKLFCKSKRGAMLVEFAILLGFAAGFMYFWNMTPAVLSMVDKQTGNTNINADAYKAEKAVNHTANPGGGTGEGSGGSEEQPKQDQVEDGEVIVGDEATFIAYEGGIKRGKWHDPLSKDNSNSGNVYRLEYPIILEGNSVYEIYFTGINLDQGIFLSPNNGNPYNLYAFRFEPIFQGTDVIIKDQWNNTISKQEKHGSTTNTVVVQDSSQALDPNHLNNMKIETRSSDSIKMVINISTTDGKISDYDIPALEQLLTKHLAIKKISK